MRTGRVAFVGDNSDFLDKPSGEAERGTAKPCCDIAKDLHVRGPPRILQQAP